MIEKIIGNCCDGCCEDLTIDDIDFGTSKDNFVCLKCGMYLNSEYFTEYEPKELSDMLIRFFETKTTIPKDRWGTHATHCCTIHGCKYGHVDCPVELGLVKQEYPCEYCNDDEDEDENIVDAAYKVIDELKIKYNI